MKKMLYAIALLAVAGITWTGCKRTGFNSVLPKPDMALLASDFNQKPNNNTAKNLQFTINNSRANLGKVLFYDPRMSRNNAIACGSCHKQNMAFADGKAVSTGFQGQLTHKNSLHLANVTQNQHLFWNGRETDLDQMVLRPVENHIEMGMEDFNTLVAKLSQEEYYQELFLKTFGSSTLTKEKIASCISEFIQSIRSVDAKFDKLGGFNYFSGKGGGQQVGDLPGFTALENEGARLFFQKYDCQGCHSVASQMNHGWSQTVADIGLDIAPTDGMQGNPGVFKTPNLRNVMLTAPYMHDGRFANMNDVLEHYAHGIKESPNLAWQLKDVDGKAKPLGITEPEKQAIIAFLSTLTDATYLTDPRYSNPFVK